MLQVWISLSVRLWCVFTVHSVKTGGAERKPEGETVERSDYRSYWTENMYA